MPSDDHDRDDEDTLLGTISVANLEEESDSLDVRGDPYDWVSWGVLQGWITAPYCDQHDGMPSELVERIYRDDLDYDDPCIPVVVLLVALDDADPESEDQTS